MLVFTRVAARESRALAGANLAASGAAVSAVPGHPPSTPAFVRAASSAGVPTAASAPGHQRRHSSSKPSSPPSDDSITAPAPAKESSPTTGGSTARKRASRRGTKEKEGAKKALPSVPSTQHLDAQAVNLASFFSLHRPISVTSPVPAHANASSFASIFNPNSPRRVNDTLLTLSSAVRALDRATGQASEESDLRAAVTQASSSNAEDADGEPVIVVSMQDLAQSFRPFHPPPPPSPPTAASTAQVNGPPRTRRASAARRTRQPMKSVTTLPSYAQRVRARRQRRWLVSTAARHAAIWRAISTRRRRQLKMKKHKFKKLQKRLRNERRRLDRL